MSILKKIRKIFEEPVVVEKIKEELSIDQISTNLKDKIKENKTKTESIKKEITKEVNTFISGMESYFPTLEKIDLSKKKEHERIKVITLENLNLYISHIKRLLYNINNLENLEPYKYLEKIFLFLNEFNKSSNLAFEKATILIGKELVEVKSKIRFFANNMERIFEGNKNLFEKEKSIDKMSKLFEELGRNVSSQEEVSKNMENIKKDIADLKDECLEIGKKILDIKESRKYKEETEKELEAKDKFSELEKNLQNFKDKINLKELAKIYHSDKKKIQLIKSYSSNFKQSLESDKNLDLGDLLTNKEADQGLLKELQSQLLELNNSQVTETEKEVFSLEEDLKKFQYKITSLEGNLQNELRKKEKILLKKEDISKEIKELSKSLN